MLMNLENLNPSAVRKYLYEYVLIALVGCVVYLFLLTNSLNNFIRDELTRQRVDMVRTVEANSNTINAFLDFQKRNYRSGN
jgi:hypothetical protein